MARSENCAKIDSHLASDCMCTMPQIQIVISSKLTIHYKQQGKVSRSEKNHQTSAPSENERTT
jgi:hypothetical protein